MGHDTEMGYESIILYGVKVLLGRARKAERKKQGVAVGVGKIHHLTGYGSPGIGRIRTS